MEFTIQDKIDIYHVILGMIEASVVPDNYYSTYSVCDLLMFAKQSETYRYKWIIGKPDYLNDLEDEDVFPEWYEFENRTSKYWPFWWSHAASGDRARCEHIRKVLRSLYKQLP